ncbi:hypothetical protein F1880_009230 [Penicillium rolfsii]|nr:hypothetical protein F1880_009230 [Penicillium rolfsii]
MRVLAIITPFTVLAIVFVAIRLWTRFRIVKSPGYDDLLIVSALVCLRSRAEEPKDWTISVADEMLIFLLSGPRYVPSLSTPSSSSVQRQYGLGVPKKDLSDHDIQSQMHYLWLSIPFYNLSLVLSKLSILVLFTRIFRSRKFLACTYTIMAILIIAGLWMVLSGFLQCIPVHYFWNMNLQMHRGHCLPEGPVWYVNAALQIFTDVVILILPMPLLWKLHLPRKQKVGMMLVFGVGIFVIATSSARLYELTQMIQSQDFTKTNSEAAVWSSLEANVSIICACLAPLHPLISRIFSFCFLPQPIHSSPATKTHSTTGTHLMSSRKHSIYDQTYPDGSVYYNDVFFSGPGAYTASVSRTNTNDDEMHGGEDEDGIRVVRELRMFSDSVEPRETVGFGNEFIHDRDFEMGLRKDSMAGTGTKGNEVGSTSIERDLGDFEFPDYKERMNAPI